MADVGVQDHLLLRWGPNASDKKQFLIEFMAEEEGPIHLVFSWGMHNTDPNLSNLDDHSSYTLLRFPLTRLPSLVSCLFLSTGLLFPVFGTRHLCNETWFPHCASFIFGARFACPSALHMYLGSATGAEQASQDFQYRMSGWKIFLVAIPAGPLESLGCSVPGGLYLRLQRCCGFRGAMHELGCSLSLGHQC